MQGLRQIGRPCTVIKRFGETTRKHQVKPDSTSEVHNSSAGSIAVGRSYVDSNSALGSNFALDSKFALDSNFALDSKLYEGSIAADK